MVSRVEGGVTRSWRSETETLVRGAAVALSEVISFRLDGNDKVSLKYKFMELSLSWFDFVMLDFVIDI